MSNTTFDRPDLSAFTRLDDPGLEVTGQRMWPDHAVLARRIVREDRWCRRCGCQGVARDTVVKHLAHVPCGWRPTIVHVSVVPLPVPKVCSRVAPGHESSGRTARQALARSGELGAHGPGSPPSNGGAHRPDPGRVLEEPPTLLS